MKTIIVDYEISGNSFRTKLRVSDENFHSMVGLSGFKTHFDNSMEIHRLKACLRQLTWLDGTNRKCSPIIITKISEVK